MPFFREALVSDMVVFPVPFRKFPEAFAEGGGRAVAVVFFQGFGIRIGGGNVTGLHGNQFLVGFKVVVLWKNAGADEFLLQDVYEAKEVFRSSAADVVDGVGRKGKTVAAVFLFRCALHDADDPFHNVINVGEIPFAVAVIENLYGFSSPQFIGKSEVGHVRPSGRAVDGKEAEARGGDVVEFGVAVGQEFVRFFGGRVEGDRMVHFIVGAEGDLGIAAVHRGGGGVDQVLHTLGASVIGVTAGFQNIVEADEVGFDVHVGVSNGVAHPGLGSQVHHDVRMPSAEDVRNAVFICYISMDEMIFPSFRRGRCLFQFLEAVFLQGYVPSGIRHSNHSCCRCR